MSAHGKPITLNRQTVAQLAAQAHARPDPGFDPAASRWHGRAIFVTGAPRSGTSWLHQMLLTHPDVATGGEMHVFCEGFASVFANFDDPDPYMNLSTWVTRSQLVALTRDFVDGVFSAAADASRPGAGWVLDKTPNHALCAQLLSEVYPDAIYIQIVRNPRDSISSARDLWSGWNPRLRDWRGAAADWRATVEDCRRHLGGLRYHEVRYEDLLAEPVKELGAILEFAGLRHDDSYVEDAVSFGKAPVNVRPSDRRISAAKWADIDPRAEQDIVAVVGDLMVASGYLDEAQRREILARHPVRRSARAATAQLAASSRTAASRGRRLSRRARDVVTRTQRSADVRATVAKLIAAAQSGDATATAALLKSDVEAELPTGNIKGAAAVAAELCRSLDGASVVPFIADEQAVAVEVLRPGKPREHHRYFVSAKVISRVVVEGDASKP
ncbi:MAG TPA: sulfotransferase [Mycobacteriales bacterium]|nr:sulfotransferase [Mycobacteriales bacterium]